MILHLEMKNFRRLFHIIVSHAFVSGFVSHSYLSSTRRASPSKLSLLLRHPQDVFLSFFCLLACGLSLPTTTSTHSL